MESADRVQAARVAKYGEAAEAEEANVRYQIGRIWRRSVELTLAQRASRQTHLEPAA